MIFYPVDDTYIMLDECDLGIVSTVVPHVCTKTGRVFYYSCVHDSQYKTVRRFKSKRPLVYLIFNIYGPNQRVLFADHNYLNLQRSNIRPCTVGESYNHLKARRRELGIVDKPPRAPAHRPKKKKMTAFERLFMGMLPPGDF